MWLKKVVLVLYSRTVMVVLLLINSFSLCLDEALLVFVFHGLLVVGQSLLWKGSDISLLFHKNTPMRASVLLIPPPDVIVGISGLPISISNCCEEVQGSPITLRSIWHRGVSIEDIIINYPATCVKWVPCNAQSFYQEMLWGWTNLMILVQITLFFSTSVMFIHTQSKIYWNEW